MRIPRLILPLLAACFDLGTAAAEPAPGKEQKFETFAESKAEYDRAVTPFLVKHCSACHNKDKSEGDLDLSALDPDMKSSSSGARWATVVEKLTKGEMPPKSKPRPDVESLAGALRWAHAEAKRSNKHFTRRAAYANGNSVPHNLLFDPKNIPPFDADVRIRRLSPEIYTGLLGDLAKGKTGVGQPFSPEGKSTFKDMGAPKIDEPVTAQLLQNAMAIVTVQTNHKIEDGKLVKIGFVPADLLTLFDPAQPPDNAAIDAAIAYQFNTILKRAPSTAEKARFAALMKKNLAEAGPVGARYTLAAVLMLPEAVFRMEVGSGTPDTKGRVRLAPREIAHAIAFALTDKRPDADLLAAAATGGLDTDAGVAKQVMRLLEDQKTDKPRILRFFREYFGYDRAPEVFKESFSAAMPLNPQGHDPRVLVEDTDQLVLHILQGDKNVLKELLTTNKSFVAYKSAATTKKQRADALAKFEAEKAKDPVKFKVQPAGPQHLRIVQPDRFPGYAARRTARRSAGRHPDPAIVAGGSFDHVRQPRDPSRQVGARAPSGRCGAGHPDHRRRPAADRPGQDAARTDESHRGCLLLEVPSVDERCRLPVRAFRPFRPLPDQRDGRRHRSDPEEQGPEERQVAENRDEGHRRERHGPDRSCG